MLEKPYTSSLRDEVLGKITKLNNLLYSLGYRVPYSQIEALYNIVETLLALSNRNSVSLEELVDIASSVYTLIPWDKGVKKKLYEMISGDKRPAHVTSHIGIQRIENKIRFGREIKLAKIFQGKLTKEDINTYILFRKIGIITRDRRGRLKAVTYSTYKKLLENIRNKTIGFNDVLKYIGEIPSRYWDLVIDDALLDNADLEQLLNIADTLRSSRNKILKKEVLRRISDRIEASTRISSRDKRIIAELIKETGSTDTKLVLKVLDKIGYSKVKQVNISNLVATLKSMQLSERQTVISKVVRYMDKDEIDLLLRSLDILSFAKLQGSNDGRLNYIGNLANALLGYINYLLLGDASYLDYSRYYLEKIDPSRLDPRFKPIYESIISGDARVFFSRAFKVADRISMVEYILKRAVELKNYGYTDEALQRALKLGLKILRRIKLDGTIAYRKIRVYYRCRNLDLRRTIYNMVRLSYKEIFVDKRRRRNTVVLLDVSGSMFNYSLWAVLSLATLMYVADYIVVFTDKAEVISVKRKTSKILYSFLKATLATGFRGYTDIERAIEEALKYNRGRTTFVLISDLKQTVKGDPVKAAHKLLNKGHELVILLPENYSIANAEKMNRIGARVIRIKSPTDIPRIFCRKLSLKSNLLKGG